MFDELGTALRSASNQSTREALRLAEQWIFAQLDLLDVKPEDAADNEDVLDVLAAALLVLDRTADPGPRRRSSRISPARGMPRLSRPGKQ